MIITQEKLMKQIANKEDIDVVTVRKIFESAEDVIFDYLSSTPPSENIVVKILNGINLERKYVSRKKYSKGMFQNIDCPEHVNVKANSSTYYSKKVNNKLYNNKI